MTIKDSLISRDANVDSGLTWIEWILDRGGEGPAAVNTGQPEGQSSTC